MAKNWWQLPEEQRRNLYSPELRASMAAGSVGGQAPPGGSPSRLPRVTMEPGKKWYQMPGYGNMVGQPPTTGGAAMATPGMRAGGYDASPLRSVFGPQRPNMPAAIIHGGKQTIAAMQAGRRRDESATEALNNVLTGNARPLYDDSFSTPYQVNSGHFVPVPGGGFRAHPMAIGAPTRPDPEWERTKAIRASAGVVDADALEQYARARQASAQAGGGGSYDINRNSMGVPTGFTVRGAMPTERGAQIQMDRLNRDITDPKMRYTLSANGRAVVDPFGQEMSYDTAARRIMALNQIPRDAKEQKMAETAQARRAMDRERQQAAAWNMAMARQINPNQPLSPIAQERAMTATMPGQNSPQQDLLRRQLELQGKALENANAQQLLQNELMKQRIGIESKIASGEVTPRDRMQFDLLERQLKAQEDERAATRQGQISQATQARANAFFTAAADPNLSPQQQNQLRMQGYQEMGIPAEAMTSPMSLGGALAGYPARLAQQFEAAKDRNEIWTIGLREGVFKPNDPESIAKFKAISRQLEKDGLSLGAVFGIDDIRRSRRGEDPVTPFGRAFRWMTGP